MSRFAALIWLVACKDRGTIAVPLLEPCTDTPDAVAVYLKRAADCATLTCGLPDFDCALPDCIAACASGGYCAPDELEGLAIDPPTGGDYALVLSYHYAGARVDEGMVCFPIHVDADGTRSATFAEEEAQRCCTRTP